MRDAHRMKDKLDLSLDSRQIVSLLVAGMVVLGAVFVLGVVVGKKLSEADRAAQSRDLLTALDEKAAAMQKVNEEPPLTFQKTLTEKAPPEPPAPKKAEATRPPPEPAKPEAAVAQAPRPEAAKPEAAKPAPAPAAEEPKPVVAEAAKPAEAPKGTVPQTPVATRTAPAEAREPVRAKTVKLAVPPPRAPMPAAAPKSGFTLQLHASQDKADADRFAASMREKGYAPYQVDADVPGRGTWHRVRLGSFPTKEAAAKYLADFKRETGVDAFVAPAQ